MATKAQMIRIYNDAIARGVSPEQAEILAGINDNNVNDFEQNADGTLSQFRVTAATPSASTPGWKPEVDEDDDEEVAYEQAAQRRGTTTTTFTTEASKTTTTGGGTKTTVVTPTEYQDTAASQAAQSRADALEAQRKAKIAELKAQGKSTGEIFKDPEVKALAAERTAAGNEAQALKTPVPGTGTVNTVQTPNTTATETSFEQGTTVSVQRGAGEEDAVVQYNEISSTSQAVPASEVSTQAQDVDPLEGDPFANQEFGDGSEELSASDIQEDPYAPDVDPYGVENEEADPTTFAENQPVQYDEFGNVIDPNTTAEGVGAFGGAGEPIATAEDAEDPYSNGDATDGLATDRLATESQTNGAGDEAAAQQAILEQARAQQAINERRRQANQGDWRVKLRLAPLADYLYKAKDPGILEPLLVTDGVVFPYTPKIDLSYRAMYDVTSATHANYNNYFYKGSMLDPVNVTATFTAQDTAEANYLLAVIHFFRSITKMFYGQDAQRGAPPPLVYLTGLGEYQFAEHPCVVHQFNYSLPQDVDYIRARSIMDPGANLQNRRSRESVATSPLSFSLKRLGSLGQNIEQGAETYMPAPATLGKSSPTYVPTRIDISLILYPIQSRAQVSQQFSLKQYANGDLLKGGFW